MAKFVAEFFPPDLSSGFVAKAAWGALQTFAVAAVGTLLAVGAASALALPAAGRFGLAARLAARLALNVLRSVPELVWAALMVIAAGLGPFAGTLALALHTTGVLGRLYAESLENLPRAPERSLREAGSGAVAAFAYAALPLRHGAGRRLRALSARDEHPDGGGARLRRRRRPRPDAVLPPLDLPAGAGGDLAHRHVRAGVRGRFAQRRGARRGCMPAQG